MDKEIFLKNFNKILPHHYKGFNGKILLIGGSWGMAGALGYNILGSLASGSTYINVMCDEQLYPILASNFLNCIFYPVNRTNFKEKLKSLLDNKVICFGSGMVNLEYKNEILDYLLANYSNTLVLDAESFNILKGNYYKLNICKASIILTPHIKEFSTLIETPIEKIRENLAICKNFAKQHNLNLILKDGQMKLFNKKGEVYYNNTGNENLARAGSGDLLAGILSYFLTFNNEEEINIKMAMWLFGHISDIAKNYYSQAAFSLENYKFLIDKFYKENNL